MQHSYSSYALYKQCPEKFNHLRILRDVKDESGPEAQRGTAEHSLIESALLHGTLLPEPLGTRVGAFIQVLRRKVASGMTLLVEYPLSIDRKHQPVDYDVGWARGRVDAILLDNLNTPTHAYIYDWKSGKVRHNPEQLQFYAWMLYFHFPTLLDAVYRYVWYNHGVITPREEDPDTGIVVYDSNSSALLNVWDRRLLEIEAQCKRAVFLPNRTPLCKFCPVLSCPGNRRGKVQWIMSRG